jgi:16S rRNA (guanine966-N2)-methyltransferase
MGEKVRGALFNTLGDIEGLTVLDAFAGSGALSFEAISRGAQHVTALEPDKGAQRVISSNIEALAINGSVKLIQAKAQSWLATSEGSFDIIFCDPPYDGVPSGLIGRLAERAKPGGLVVLSLPPQVKPALDSNFELLASKNYGDAALYFYRRKSS